MEHLIELLADNNIIEKDRSDEYLYYITVLVEKTIVYCVLTIQLFLLKKPIEGFIFLCCLMLLRRTTGGYHADCFLKCFMGSVLLVLLSVMAVTPFLMEYKYIALIALVVSVMIIYLFAPVNHPNLNLNKKEWTQNRKLSRLILLIQLLVICLGFLYNRVWQWNMVTAIVICAILILAAKLLGQEVKI